MSKVTIKQHGITDYRTACLTSISAYYDLQLFIACIRQYTGTYKKGTNVPDMVETAKKLGFEAKGGGTEQNRKI